MKRGVFLVFFLMCGGVLPAHAQTEAQAPIVQNASRYALSQGVKLTTAQSSKPARRYPVLAIGHENSRGQSGPNLRRDVDAAPANTSAVPMPAPSLSFDGLANYDNIAAYSLLIIPPDMIGDVGPNHYVQAVNALVRVYDKTGNPLTPPFKMSDLFAPLGTPCSTRNDGEPVVVYDPLADRWLLSQYCNNFPPFRQMIAVSKTGDPTGAYHVYEFVMPSIRLNDVAKFGVWPDAYYMSTEEFTGADFAGTGMFAFDRNKMLVGDPTALYIYFNRPSTTTVRLGNVLPSDLDGLRPPPVGAPNIFIGYTATEYGDAQDAIRLFDFHADFVNPSNATFTERPESPLIVAAFDPTSPVDRADIAQPPPGERLDANSDRLNYRAAYRNNGSSESLVVNQTVRLASDPYRAGVRLYELRRTGLAFAVAEQSTIGNTTSSRWIGSAAQDHQGNLAVGYNLASENLRPSIHYTGRLATEPAGTFRDEGTLIAGTGVQKAFGFRWGDYSGMAVDPVDDCTFWMTGEYYTLESQNFSDFTWLTRIGAFKFAECTAASRATLMGRVTNSATGEPIAGVRIFVSALSRITDENGNYGPIMLLPGTYAVLPSAHGFRAPGIHVVQLVNGQTLTRDIVLDPVPVLINAGTAVSSESCAGNGAPDPGERLTVSLALRNTGAQPTQNLTAELRPTGGVTNPSPAQNYGALPVNGPAVSRPFTFTVDPNIACGSQITLTFRVLDGFLDLGTVVIVMQTGAPKIAFQENFDRTQQGGLPLRWTRSAFAIVNMMNIPESRRRWRVSAKRFESNPKSAFSPDLNQVGVGEMTSPVFTVTSSTARLTFRNWYETETTFLRNRLYDGSVLEIKIGGGAWQDILDAGGIFESGGYDGRIDACCSNPLGGRLGWSGRSGVNATPEFITTSVRLPTTAANQPTQLRWRLGTDIGGFREGQYIDDLVITDGFVCACSGN